MPSLFEILLVKKNSVVGYFAVSASNPQHLITCSLTVVDAELCERLASRYQTMLLTFMSMKASIVLAYILKGFFSYIDEE